MLSGLEVKEEISCGYQWFFDGKPSGKKMFNLKLQKKTKIVCNILCIFQKWGKIFIRFTYYVFVSMIKYIIFQTKVNTKID